jgi:hypothetical protein
MTTQSFQAGLIGVFIVVVVSFVARFAFLGGSMFDPSVAPGVGPLALGDLLVIGAFAVGYFWVRMKKQS